MSDISITPASVIPSANAIIKSGIAGATITQGQTVYIDSSANYVLKLADADASALSAVVAGIASSAGAAGQRINYIESDPALTFGGTVLSGDPIYQSDVAGGLTKTFADLETGDIVTVLGVATSTTTMNFKPVQGGTI